MNSGRLLICPNASTPFVMQIYCVNAITDPQTLVDTSATTNSSAPFNTLKSTRASV